MANESQRDTNIEDFLFKTPLYVNLTASKDDLYPLIMEPILVDGYCPHCGQSRTFSYSAGTYHYEWWRKLDHNTSSAYDDIELTCTRFDSHKIRFFLLISNGGIQKLGQNPSFADIAIDESKQYTKLLNANDKAEFHKALGLAAHGVGIGSFVYIRRIFERLIQKRFDEYKQAEGWDDEEYRKLRMAERIEFLKGHLPDFLVRNAKIYSILSVGIHELTEEKCLAIFDVLKMSTIVILEGDKKKKEELERQQALEKAIATFETPKKKRSGETE